MDYNKEDILGYQCLHAVYCPPPQGERDDYHLVKENIHLKDGRVIPNVRMIKNFKRSFWITKKGFRNHEQKKESEFINRLERFETTESKMIFRIANALEMPWFKGTLRELSNSPYLYGTDIFSTAIIKNEYKRKYPELMKPSTVAAYDVETYMGSGEIIMATISFKDRVCTAVDKSFFNGYANAEERTKEAFNKYLEKYINERNIKWELVLVDKEIDIIKETFKRAHQWQPDFLAIWNINFDMHKILAACERAGVDPKDIFSDPKVPKPYRHFKYKEGKKTRVMASGKSIPINMADQWHVVYTPSSFYFIDAMCVYRKLRVQRGELPRYGLDFVLNKELGERKLKFDQANHVEGGDWHELMQSTYKAEYVAYNIFDCIGMELLDEKILDLAIDIPTSCAYSDFASFESQPKRAIDELHYYLQDSFDSIIGSTGKEMLGELDKLVPPNTDLIVNLKGYLITDEGQQCIDEYPELKTKIRRKCFDSDVD